MQWLVQHMIFILLLYKWRISTASSSPLKIAKEHCASQCGNVSIPYPFGIGRPNNHCYFDEWYEIECNPSFPVPKPFLRRLQLEVLNISVENATVQVTSPITYFSCKGKQSRPAANLTGSPFMYSQGINSFVAISCDLFASLRTGSKHTVAGCTSTCTSYAFQSLDMCEYGLNCCRTALSQYINNFSVKQEPDETRRNATDCEDYAFLVDKRWFEDNKSNFIAIKGMDVVPVMLDWSLILENNKSLIKQFEALHSLPDRRSHDSTPTCDKIGAVPSFNHTWYRCLCPAGFEGNPYLLQRCQAFKPQKPPPPTLKLSPPGAQNRPPEIPISSLPGSKLSSLPTTTKLHQQLQPDLRSLEPKNRHRNRPRTTRIGRLNQLNHRTATCIMNLCFSQPSPSLVSLGPEEEVQGPEAQQPEAF